MDDKFSRKKYKSLSETGFTGDHRKRQKRHNHGTSGLSSNPYDFSHRLVCELRVFVPDTYLVKILG